MNGLTAALAAAQQSVSPVCSLSVRAEPRSSSWLEGGDPWETVAAFPAGLAAWNAQSIATDAAAGSTGILRVFLSWKEGRLVSQYVTALGFGVSSTWTTPNLVTVASFAAVDEIGAPKPAVVYEGNRWHVYYRLPDGNLYSRVSSNDGVTWSSATAIYTGGDAIGDLFACFLPESAIHVVQFSTATDAWRPRGLSRRNDSGTWSLWSAHSSALGWLPAGMIPIDGYTLRQLFFADTVDPYAHTLSAITCTLNADGTLASRSITFTTLWHVEGNCAIRPARHAVGRGFGGWLHSCQENARTRTHLCAGGVDGATLLLEEPVPLAGDPLPVAPLERHTIPVAYGVETLLVGLASVQRSVAADDVLAATESDIIAYRHEVRANGPGSIELIVRPGSPLSHVCIGYGLWVTRGCRKGENAGSATLGFRVVRVERRADVTRISGLDALGILAATRLRRPFQFAPSAFTQQRGVDALAGWAGLATLWETSLGGSAPLMTWQGGEDGLSALQRMILRAPVVLRSRVSDPGSTPCVVLSAPSAAAGYAYGSNAHPVIQCAAVEDSRTPRLAVAHGVAARFSPAAGEDWDMAFAPAFAEHRSPLVRPLPRYQMDRGWEAADQSAIVAAWRVREGQAIVAGWIEAQANFALEPNDTITMEGTPYHVLRLVERWQERRVLQRIELAAV